MGLHVAYCSYHEWHNWQGCLYCWPLSRAVSQTLATAGRLAVVWSNLRFNGLYIESAGDTPSATPLGGRPRIDLSPHSSTQIGTRTCWRCGSPPTESVFADVSRYEQWHSVCPTYSEVIGLKSARQANGQRACLAIHHSTQTHHTWRHRCNP